MNETERERERERGIKNTIFPASFYSASRLLGLHLHWWALSFFLSTLSFKAQKAKQVHEAAHLHQPLSNLVSEPLSNLISYTFEQK